MLESARQIQKKLKHNEILIEDTSNQQAAHVVLGDTGDSTFGKDEQLSDIQEEDAASMISDRLMKK